MSKLAIPKVCEHCVQVDCDLNHCTECSREVCSDCWYGYHEATGAEVCYDCAETEDKLQDG